MSTFQTSTIAKVVDNNYVKMINIWNQFGENCCLSCRFIETLSDPLPVSWLDDPYKLFGGTLSQFTNSPLAASGAQHIEL